MKWIDSLARRLGVSARANRNARRSAPAHLRLTQLEDRAVPAVITWDGGGGDSNWTTAANWVGDVAPVAGDDLVFAAGAAQLSNLNDFVGGTNFNSIVIEGEGYTISGNSVDLTGDVTTTYVSGTSTFDVDSILGGGDVIVGAGGSLVFSGVISGTAGLTVSGGGTLRLSGALGNGYSGGTTLVAGTLELDKSSAVAVPAGTLIIGDATGTDVVRLLASNQIADGTDVSVVGATSTLDLNGFDDAIGTLAMTAGTVQTGVGTLTLGGDVTTNSAATEALISGNLDLGGATRTVSVGGGTPDPDLRITANISGTGAGLTLVGGVTGVELSGNNTYDGLTTISSGSVRAASANALGSATAGTLVNSGATLALTSNTTIMGETLTISGNGVAGILGALNVFTSGETNTFAGNIILAGNSLISISSGTLVLSGEISESGGARSLTVSGSGGRLILSGSNTYSGSTSVTSGYLRVTNDNALGDPSASTIASFANTATLELSGGVTLPATKSVTLSLNGVNNTEPKVINVASNNMILGAVTFAGNEQLDVAGGTTLTLAGGITETGGSRFLLKSGAGTLALTGTSSYTGATFVSGGTLAANSLGSTSGLTLSGSTLTTAGSSLSTSALLTLSVGGGTVDLSNGSITLSGISGTSNLTVNSTAGGNVLSTATDNSGTFSGTTTLNGGILQFANAAPYGTGTIAINGGRVRTMTGGGQTIANPLALGGTLQMSGSGPLTFTGPVDLLSDNRIVNNTIASALTLSGVVSNGNLTVSNTGAGAVVLGGTNTHGTTTLTAGTLSVTDDTNLGSGAVALSGGTLLVSGGSGTIDNGFTIGGSATLNNGNDLTLSGVLSGSATLTKSGSGTLTLTNTSNESGWSGNLIAQGNIELPSDDALPAGNIDLAGGWLFVTGTTTIDNAITLSSGTTVLSVTTGETVTLTGPLAESGGGRNLNKSGGGTLVMAGTASYTGNTVLNGGTVSVGSDAAVGSGQIIINNSSPTLEITGSLSRNINVNNPGTISNAGAATLSGVLSGAGALTKSGSGELTLTSVNSHSGTTTVAAGTLLVNGDVSSSSAVTVATGATLGGSGTIPAFTLASGGTLAPGNSPGALTSGDLNFTSGSTFAVELDGTTAGTQYDQANVTGTVTLADATLNLTLGFTPVAGDSFTIVENDGSDAVSGTFTGLAEGALVTSGATSFRISYVGGTGNDVVLTVLETPIVTGAASANPATFGQAVIFTGTVSGTGTPTGNVALVIDGTTVETVALDGNGVATFAPVSNLAVGTRTVSFEYAGDVNNLPSTGTLSGGLVVTPAVSVTTVTTPASSTTVGQAVTFTATVTSAGGTPTGTVTFVNATTGQTLGTVTLDGNGVASFTTSELPAGVNRIEIAYSGDGNSTSSTVVVNQRVDSPSIAVSIGSGTGDRGTIQLFDLTTGATATTLVAFPGYSGEIRVATGDVTGDGVADTIAAVGAGPTGGHVKVFNGATGELRYSFYAFPGYSGGVFVTSGDVNGDGYADVIAAAGPGGGPHVKVFSGTDGSELFSFLAYAPTFAGGVHVATGDVDGDGRSDIITGAGAGGAPHVKVFSGTDLTVLRSFYAYASGFTGGVFVGAGDFDDDGRSDIITGAGAGGAPHVKVFSGTDLTVQGSFLAFAPDFQGGVRVGSSVVDGVRAVITGAGPGGGPHVKAYDLQGNLLRSFFAIEADFSRGVYVG